jgi:glucose-1-phosphatase
MQSFKNIIFDLGGVLLDIDFEQSQKAFNQLGIQGFRDMVSPFHGIQLFNDLEKGMDIPLFYRQFRELTGKEISDNEIENAWCALLLCFREGSIERLLQLKSRYKTYLLSNTNEIHLQRIYQIFRNQFDGKELDDCFNIAYYSHRIQQRKPDAKAWLHVLDRHQLKADETLFIDDSAANIEAAQLLGMQTIHLLPGLRVEDFVL